MRHNKLPCILVDCAEPPFFSRRYEFQIRNEQGPGDAVRYHRYQSRKLHSSCIPAKLILHMYVCIELCHTKMYAKRMLG